MPEQVRVGDRHRWCAVRLDDHHFRLDFRAWDERAGRDAKCRAHLRGELRQHRQRAVDLAPGRRNQTFDHLALQRQHHAGEAAALRQRRCQDRRRDVVGQVANQNCRRTRTQERGEVHRQHVGFDDVDLRQRRELRAQPLSEISIHLDQPDFVGALDKQLRQGPQAGTDLDDAFGVWAGKPHDALGNLRIGEEVLPEPLPRVPADGGERAAHAGSGAWRLRLD